MNEEMKFKAVWKTDACEVVAPAILSVLRDNSNEKCSIKLTPSRYDSQIRFFSRSIGSTSLLHVQGVIRRSPG